MNFVDANGLRFAYLEQGTGPLVLMLHGFPDTAYTWEHAMPELAAAGYRVVAPFMRGYHPTQLPPYGQITTEAIGRDTLGLITALGDGKPAIVVGHDWGASAAYAASTIDPSKIRLVVTLAIPHPRSIKPGPKIAWTLRHFLRLRSTKVAAWIRAGDLAYIDELVRRWSPSWKDVPANETAHVKAAFAEPGCLEAACSYYINALALPAILREPVKTPAIAFAGEHDNIAPRAYEKARHCFEASYEVIQVPGGHFMHREHPAAFNAALVQALRDHDGRAEHRS